MKITFLGGADEVGASSTLIEMGGKRILVDAGIRPSPKARWGLAGDQLPDLSQLDVWDRLDAILVTHAHTDHTGALELVVSRFPDAPVYATAPTVALTRVLHQDARRIMQTRLDEEGELPLFDDVAVQRLMAAFSEVPFNARLPLGEGLAVTFFPAGHIAGAAMLGLESDEGRLLVSGDLSISPQRTVDGARPPAFRPDVLLIESTYGGRLHANRAVQERKLVETVGRVTAEGGKVLIPAFALGRAQEILLILGEAQRRGDLPATPVWADGMVRAICQVYTSFVEILPLPLQERGAAFFDGHIHAVQSNEQRNALVWGADPAVIVASSGMLAGGPSLSYARALAGKPQHAILLTGYQDEESPGRRLQEVAERGTGSIRLGKDKVDVQCHLGTYSLSAHADEGQLISLVETLDPAHVLLVHGDEAARTSLGRALEERGRDVRHPRAGQTLEFRLALQRPVIAPKVALAKLDARALWQETAAPGGGYFTLEELCRAGWGTCDAARLAELAAMLEQDDLYFEKRPLGVSQTYRARTDAQVQTVKERRQRMAVLPEVVGRWLVLRDRQGGAYAARGAAARRDHLAVCDEDGVEQIAFPEDVLVVLGETPPSDEDLNAYRHTQVPVAAMEPNQALAVANQHFSPDARLRKSGYRLGQRVLVLTFDFPDAASQQYAGQIASLEAATGWTVEVSPEANQMALNSLAREVLPAGWMLVKGPAIHRELKKVALTVSAPDLAEDDLQAARQRFRDASGFDLEITRASQPVTLPAATPLAENSEPAAAPWEINAAYAAIRAGLADSTLYRTSQKGDQIMLSFISRQVGERYQAQIAALERQVGWRLSINPQPNQGAILEAARYLVEQAGWAVLKGPSIYPERGEVTVALSTAPDEAELARLVEACLAQTGFRLAVSVAQPVSQPAAARSAAPDVVEIPLNRIRLRAHQQSLLLDPTRLAKAVERARRMGITPPIEVRRVADGYILLDGLYRLRAAEALHMERIPAIVS